MKNPSEEALLRTIQQGIIQERSRGLLEFCLPGFKEYLLERLAEEREA